VVGCLVKNVMKLIQIVSVKDMGKVKQWLMNMEEDAAEMSKLIFCLKHGAVHQDIWDRVNDPNYDDGMREPEEVRDGSVS